MAMQDTSVDSYVKLVTTGRQKELDTKVFNHIKEHGPMHGRCIAQDLKLPTATISGATNRLMNDGLIFKKEKVYDSGTKRTVWAWDLTPKGQDIVLSATSPRSVYNTQRLLDRWCDHAVER